MRFARLAIVTLLTLASTRVTAQQQSSTPPRQQTDTSRKAPGSGVHQGDFIVKTITLHHLSSGEAMRLLSPYSVSPGGGVFEVPNVRAVTIREVPRIYSDMMNVLEKYDREPASVVLNFQLVAAEPTNTRDPAVAGIDSLLRNVLKFSGYRLLGTAVATTGENHMVTQTIAGDSETLSLTVSVSDVRVEGNDASVNLRVSLERPAVPATTSAYGRPRADLLSTGVTVPMGQTVLLGTSASENGQRALILTVRPQLAKR
jgi:hypothetical protein